MIRALACAGLAALLAACAPASAVLPPGPIPAGAAIAISALPAPLNPDDPGQDRLGSFVYAGGLHLSSDQTGRLHGLSDLAVSADGRLASISDAGDLLTARLTLDAAGRPTGLADARLGPLPGMDGAPLQGKGRADAEGLALMAGGDRLVSFEHDHRIWRYPAAGGPPRPAPMPAEAFTDNNGMEAIAALPGPGAYAVGAEDSGHTWSCRLSGGCRPSYSVEIPAGAGAGLVGAAALPGGRIAWLIRAWRPLAGNHIALTIRDPAGAEIDRLELARPLTVDNFEGLAAVPQADGRIRLYLISDDNFSPQQRTLLLAFDWTPPHGVTN